MSSSSLPPLIFFFILLHSLCTVADHHLTKSRFRTPPFSPLFTSSLTQNVPTRYFEVKKPPFPTTQQQPCSQRILHHDFSNTTYGKPPVTASYALPSHCPSKTFSKIVLEFKATCKGLQFDRIFGIWLNGVELLRSCTAEPTPNGIVWSVEKDVTKYHSLLVKNETQILSVFLGTLVNEIYNGVYHVDVIFHYYPLQKDDSSLSPGYTSPQADLILPISNNVMLNDGLWFEVSNANDSKYKEVEIPRNVYRAVLEVYVSFHENDEFWYGNFPTDFVTANNLSVAGNGPFREVVVTLDGDTAGAVWPFPVVFTGGFNPLLWRPITAIGSFDLPSYDIEITPFLGRLLDGKSHKLGFSVTNALNVWYIDANLHLWLDRDKEIVEGKVLEIRNSSLKTSSVSKFKGLNGNFTTKAKRSITSIGLVKSSHGDIITTANQEFSYVNNMVLGKDGDLQITNQLIHADDRIRAKKASRDIYTANSIKSFPFYLQLGSLEEQNHTSLHVVNISMAFNEERSQIDNESMKTFKSKLENKQEGQAVAREYGRTQQVYKYVGSDQCYLRNISSFNYAILYDKVETACARRKTVKLT